MKHAFDGKITVARLVPCLILLLLALRVQAGETDSPALGPLPLTMEQAVNEGLRRNLDLIAAKYNIPLAEADELTAGLWGNPQLQLDTTGQPFGKNWDQTSVGGPRQYDLVIQQPFDLSGKHSAAKKSARVATQVAEATFQDAVRQKVLQIRLAYVDVLTAKQQVGLVREREADLKQLVEMLRGRIGGRTLLPLVQRRAELARAQAALNVESRSNALRVANTSLALLLGRPPFDGIREVTAKLRDFTIARLPKVDELLKRALQFRPDLKALQLGVTKSDADIELARAQVWDDINISFGAGYQSSQSANPGDPTSSANPGAFSWQAAIQIPLPILNRNQGNIQKASLTREQSNKEVDALDLSIRQEIDADYEQIELNQHLIETYEGRQLDDARKIHDAEQTQFGTGNSALLDYFDAMGAYYDTLSSYYDAVGEYRRSVARIQASIGKDEL